MVEFFAVHRALLERAIAACRDRGYFSAYAETPSGRIYGETARQEGEAAFQALLGKPFALEQHGDAPPVGEEVSPYGFALGITYPARSVDRLIAAAQAAGPAWAAATPEERAGVALEILARLNRQSFLMAQAVQHTTGQAFLMAFQAGGPHAQERGLEAVALAFEEMARIPRMVRWEKPQAKGGVLCLDKTWRIIPRGLGLVIACSTFPNWNAYPGLFASLVTGNAVIVKPHPSAILPLALTVRTARSVLAEAGFDPDVVQLAPDSAAAPLAPALATHPAVGIVDFTGSPAFGRWLREHVRNSLLFTEEAGINPVVIAGSSNFRGMCANLAFSLSLYSGQMCTTPRNLFLPAAGIPTDEGWKSFDAVAQGIADAIDALLADRARAEAILGAIASPLTLARIAAARRLGRVVRDSAPLAEGGLARTATPLLIAVGAEDEQAYSQEHFGPIALLIRCRDVEEALRRACSSVREHGAITAALYACDEATIARAAASFAPTGVALSVNLTGGIYVNQSAAFSDYHVSGLNPAGNACLVDTAFVANRFRVAALRQQIAA